MSVPRFYHPTLGPGELPLSDAEGEHARGARRLHPGDAVVLFDGAGGEADAEVVALSPRVVVRIGAVRSVPRAVAYSLTLGVSMPKQGRQDTLIEKCTELGVAAIRPIRAERTVAEASAGRVERWRRVSIAAAKQSQQAWIPEIREPASMAELAALAEGQDLILLADFSADALPVPVLLDRRPGAKRILALVGPEGGFTDAERAAAVACGAQPCGLTLTVLRVETAAIALAAVVLCRRSCE